MDQVTASKTVEKSEEGTAATNRAGPGMPATTEAWIERATGPGGAFELVRNEEGTVSSFRRGAQSAAALFRRMPALAARTQLLHGRGIAFAEIYASARAFAAALPMPLGGRKCGIYVQDPVFWIRSLTVVLASGGCAVLLDANQSPIDALSTAAYAGCDIILADQAGDLAGLSESTLTIIDLLATHTPGQTIQFPNDAPRDAPALVIFTSGSTGRPKAVVHSHGSVAFGLQNMLLAGSLANIGNESRASGAGGAPVVLLLSPLNYIAGVAQVLLAYLTGAMLIPLISASGATIAQLSEEHGATHIVGATIDQIRELIGIEASDGRGSTLRSIQMYGGQIPPDLQEALKTRFPNLRLSEAFGLTEAFGPVAARIRSEDDTTRFRLLPTLRARVADGGEVSETGRGRLQIAGPSLMLGYSGDASGTALEWYDTGDLVDLGPDGFLSILDRASRHLSTAAGGFYLSDLETRAKAAGARDAVADIEANGAAIRLYMVIAEPTAAEIAQTMSDAFGVPVLPAAVPTIPRKHGGKIDFMQLRAAGKKTGAGV